MPVASFQMAENRQDRLLMRQRGAGTRQIKDLDFQLILPGLSSTLTLPPRGKPSEASWPATEANSLPQRSPHKTPQASIPLFKSAQLPSAINLQKRKPGRPPKPRLPPIENEISIPKSIPTQSDGEGSITKKRKLVSKTGDQARSRSKEITITQSTEKRESPSRANQDHLPQYNDTRPESPPNLVNDQKMNELACRVLENEIGSKTSAEPRDCVNPLLSDAKQLSSPKHVSRVLHQILDGEIGKTVKIPGQFLPSGILSETEKVARSSQFGDGEESIDLPPADVNLQQKPKKRRRKFVGDIQRFVDKDIEVLMSGNSATVTTSENGRHGKSNAPLKTAKPRGRPKKVLNVIGLGSPLEETLKDKKPGQTKSGMQSSQGPGYPEKGVRRRGRPKKIASINGEAGDLDEVPHGITSSEGDLGERRSQIRNPQEKPSIEIEEQPVYDIKGKIRESTLHDVSGSLPLEGSLSAQNTNPLGNPPLETKKQRSERSVSPAGIIDPLDKSSDAHLHDDGSGLYPTNLQSKARGHLSKKSRLRGEADSPLGASNGSRIHGSEFDMHIVDPCEIMSSGTQGQSSKVPIIQGQASYSPGNFYSALIGKRKRNKEIVNPVKKASSTMPEPPQTIPQTQNVTIQNETASQKRLAPLQPQSTKIVSHEKRDRDKSFAPASERVEKEEVFQSLEVHNDGLSVHTAQITDSSTKQPGQSEAHPERQLLARTKSKSNDIEPPHRNKGDPQAQVPRKKRGRRKKEIDPHAEFPSKTRKAKEGSKTERRYASSKPSSNLIPISVYRLSYDKGESATVPPDSAVYINDKCVSAADILAQICHEFTMTSRALANHSVQSSSLVPSKAELKRRLEVNEDGCGTLDESLFQLDVSDKHIASSTLTNIVRNHGGTLQAELNVHRPDKVDIASQEPPNRDRSCSINEPKYLATLLNSIETAVIRGHELDRQGSVETARHQDQLLDLKTLEMLLQNRAKGVSVGELTGTENSKTLKGFNGVLKRAITTR